MKDSIVVSEDIRELPETGEAIFINKAGQKIKFIDGNIVDDCLIPGNKDKTITI